MDVLPARTTAMCWSVYRAAPAR